MHNDVNHTTFTNLWMTSKAAVEAFLASMLHDRNQVDDVMQEVAMALYQQFERYDQEREFVPWAISVARNKAYYHLRSRSARQRILTEAASIHLAESAARLANELGERERALTGCLKKLPARSDRLLRLHYADGFDLTAIAARCGLTISNVKVLLHRIRATLRECIEKHLKRDQMP